MTTIDKKGAFHDSQGRYADKPGSGPGFSLFAVEQTADEMVADAENGAARIEAEVAYDEVFAESDPPGLALGEEVKRQTVEWLKDESSKFTDGGTYQDLTDREAEEFWSDAAAQRAEVVLGIFGGSDRPINERSDYNNVLWDTELRNPKTGSVMTIRTWGNKLHADTRCVDAVTPTGWDSYGDHNAVAEEHLGDIWGGQKRLYDYAYDVEVSRGKDCVECGYPLQDLVCDNPACTVSGSAYAQKLALSKWRIRRSRVARHTANMVEHNRSVRNPIKPNPHGYGERVSDATGKPGIEAYPADGTLVNVPSRSGTKKTGVAMGIDDRGALGKFVHVRHPDGTFDNYDPNIVSVHNVFETPEI